MAFKGRKAVDPHVVMAEVVNTKRITPNMMRVTLGGDELAQLTPAGYDQWFRLFLPRAGQDMLRLPTRTSGLWYAEYLTTPKARRPWVRNYTVRAARPDLNEIDVDFVLHAGEHDTSEGAGHVSGPGAGFAQAADHGMRVGILDQGVTYDPRHPHDWTLLVADESGLPAVAGICESLPDDARGIAVVEVPTAGDEQEFRAPSGVEVRWVVRSDGDAHAVPGRAALAELQELDLTGFGTAVYAFAVGEASLATGARRHLVNERGVPKSHVDFVGYWRHGRSSPG
ncbi:siderophore-interacting protein [Promicromonospora iranensis]|uniref:NADPH-dependent ferric siderophore reductase n=1 Tax=Promicromonospora iranensis TaxID=1105144 RepID=A0ABU2CT96_9MICO|nr:siderophore-interacting protein [Promicromonospora iranensis]MDR7384562.1 NADPH-dependent ferric siderophore reductase [Promicromonospora iranensis]